MQNNNTILIVILVIAVIAAFYFYNQNNKTKAADAAIANSPVVTCVPFSKAQQDAEKRQKQADCAKKLLIPFVGPAQYTACMKNISVSLTPVKNC